MGQVIWGICRCGRKWPRHSWYVPGKITTYRMSKLTPSWQLVAGTVGGSQFGVAKNVSLIAVKVLDDSGSGYISDMWVARMTFNFLFDSRGSVSALDWVSQQAAATGNPSIATMSLSGLGQAALDTAVASLTSAGIHVTVAGA